MDFIVWHKFENRQLTLEEIRDLISKRVIFIDLYYRGDKTGKIFINTAFSFDQYYELRPVNVTNIDNDLYEKYINEQEKDAPKE